MWATTGLDPYREIRFRNRGQVSKLVNSLRTLLTEAVHLSHTQGLAKCSQHFSLPGLAGPLAKASHAFSPGSVFRFPVACRRH